MGKKNCCVIEDNKNCRMFEINAHFTNDRMLMKRKKMKEKNQKQFNRFVDKQIKID